MAEGVKISKSEFKKRWMLFKEGIALDLVNALQQKCPVDTGRLRSSIKSRVGSDGIIISMEGYAVYVEFGTPPHIIEARNKKSLHWKKDGKDYFAVKVHHPGTRPNPFIRTVFRTELSRIIKNNARRHFG